MRSGRAFWRDDRFIQIAAQVAVIAVVAGLLYLAFRNMADALARQGITLGFGFLESAAGFDLGESLIPYSNTDTFARALLAGLLNNVSSDLSAPSANRHLGRSRQSTKVWRYLHRL